MIPNKASLRLAVSHGTGPSILLSKLQPLSSLSVDFIFEMASRPLNDDEVLSEMNKMVHFTALVR